MRIDPGKIYIHADGGRYRVLSLALKVKCTVTVDWHKAVSYEPAEYGSDKNYGNGEVFVRTQDDFCERFELETNRKG